MNIFFLVLLLVLPQIGSCSVPKKDNSYDDTMRVIDQYSKLIKREESIRRSSYGLFYEREDKTSDSKIHVIALGYDIEKNFKYEEARKYFYSIVDGLIECINRNTQLGKYFLHYPIDYSDLEIDFAFWEHTEHHLKRDDLHSIHIGCNKIYYEIVEEEVGSEIEADQISPDIYIVKGMLERNRSIIRSISEDLAMHSKET